MHAGAVFSTATFFFCVTSAVASGFPVERQEQDCVDVPGWLDSLGNDCDHYSYAQGFYCLLKGWGFENDGYTADEACCVCGGGSTGSEGGVGTSRTPTREPSTEPTIAPTPAQSAEPTIPPTPEPITESTIPPTPEPSTESMIRPTLEPSPESSPESKIPPTPEPSPESAIPPTPQPTNPPTLPSASRPTTQTEPPIFKPPDFSIQRFRAEGIKMTLGNVEPLGGASVLRWQDITGSYLAVDMKDTIGHKLVKDVEVSVTLTYQDPPFVSKRDLVGTKMSSFRRLQTVEELIFDADMSIQSDVDARAVSHIVEESFNKDEYLLALMASGDSMFANVENVSVTPATSVIRVEVEDPTKTDKSGTLLIVSSVTAGIAAMSLVALFLVGRRTSRKLRMSPSVAKSGISFEDMSKASSSKSYYPWWLSHRVGSVQESTSDSIQGTNGSISKSTFSAPSDVDEEIVLEERLSYIPTNTLGDADEESVGGASFSSITSDDSYSTSNWSLPPVSVADEEFALGSYRTNDEISDRGIKVRVPAGALGVVLETPNDGIPSVHHIKSNSPLAGQVRVGDRLVAVDGSNVSSMNAVAVSRLIASKKDNTVRELTFARPK
jgi:hypothetical protein